MNIISRTPPPRVRPLRALSFLLAFTAAVGLVFGTAGFTAISADRGVAVNVTDDPSSYLGYEPVTHTVHDGAPTDVVEYRNQFGVELDEFTVDVSSDYGRVEVVSTPGSLGEGTKSRVTLVVRCDTRTDVPLEFDADGTGDGVSVSLDRTHTVTCVPRGPTVTGVRYSGVGNARVSVNGTHGTAEATVWLTEANPDDGGSEGSLRAVTVANLTTGEPVRPQLSNASNARIVAVEFRNQGIAYFHPGWDGERHADPRAGDGIAVGGGPLDATAVSNTSVVDENPD